MSALPPGYRLSLDLQDADPVAAHAFLTRSYWSPGIPLETVRAAMAHSICCTVHHQGGQVAMARVISDKATFAYLADVYVLEVHQGRGLAQAMLAALHDHPELQGLRRWLLFTRDAHSLYAKFGWQGLNHPERAMLRDNPDIYRA
ncbi:MAG: GNAT family N-acetyltransferase [Sphingomonadales bacterium]|nr:GNAT family N-acetyltransferase [Sphingomonadales bacterium]